MPTIPDSLDQIGFDDEHINHERNHDVTKEQAISYIQNAVVQVERNKGAYINYYSVDGAAYVMPRKKLIRTAVKAEDYQKDVAKMLEVILNGVE